MRDERLQRPDPFKPSRYEVVADSADCGHSYPKAGLRLSIVWIGRDAPFFRASYHLHQRIVAEVPRDYRTRIVFVRRRRPR